MSNLPQPVHRHEEVRETSDGVVVERAHVSQDVGAERRQVTNWINSFVWLIFGLINGLIAIRFVLRLIAANPDNPFARFIYGITDLFLLPFFGLTITPNVGGMVLELHSLIAIIVYVLVAWLITRVISLMLYRPSARTVSTTENINTHRH
jgi:YggT family protein